MRPCSSKKRPSSCDGGSLWACHSRNIASPISARLARALLRRFSIRFSSVLILIRCWAFQAASPARSEALAMALLTMSILYPTHVTWNPHDGQNSASAGTKWPQLGHSRAGRAARDMAGPLCRAGGVDGVVGALATGGALVGGGAGGGRVASGAGGGGPGPGGGPPRTRGGRW